MTAAYQASKDTLNILTFKALLLHEQGGVQAFLYSYLLHLSALHKSQNFFFKKDTYWHQGLSKNLIACDLFHALVKNSTISFRRTPVA
jgi:hypothetical protein